MKLIHKTSRYYLGYTLFILALGTVLFYFLIRIVLIDGVDEALHQEEIQIIENLQYEKIIDSIEPSPDIKIRRINLNKVYPEKYTTVKIYDESEKDFVNFRQLKKIYKYGDSFYEISIRQSLEEAESLLASLLPAVAFLFLFILAGVFLINTYISNEVWQPFYVQLEKLKKYDLVSTKILPYEHSDIREFNELSLGVEKMTKQIYQDFLNQKEFNENSSHEMQTPLAIIRNKLDLLIQSRNLSEQDLTLIEGIYEAVKRLSLLNRGLLLISKIDNHQFNEIEQVEMEKVIKKTIEHLSPQIEDKNIHVTLNIYSPCIIPFNSILADILITNLVSNAIKHNIEAGRLYIELSDNDVVFENTGLPLKIQPELLFERFKKSSSSENSIGLGLAIVKKICDLFNFRIEYVNENDLHTITIKFS
jgi:signal transduction histidine kinase